VLYKRCPPPNLRHFITLMWCFLIFFSVPPPFSPDRSLAQLWLLFLFLNLSCRAFWISWLFLLYEFLVPPFTGAQSVLHCRSSQELAKILSFGSCFLQASRSPSQGALPASLPFPEVRRAPLNSRSVSFPQRLHIFMFGVIIVFPYPSLNRPKPSLFCLKSFLKRV